MAAHTVMTIGSDDRFLGLLRWQLQDHADGAIRMAVVGSIEEACSLLEEVRPRLIVVEWGRGRRYEELNRLLWKTTVLAKRIPVLIVADWYRIDQATRLYRMGVAEYISRSHHEHRFGRILETYLGRRFVARPGSTARTDRYPSGLGAGSSRTMSALSG
jgi:DNA-binding NarL/FixJ family response regulator